MIKWDSLCKVFGTCVTWLFPASATTLTIITTVTPNLSLSVSISFLFSIFAITIYLIYRVIFPPLIWILSSPCPGSLFSSLSLCLFSSLPSFFPSISFSSLNLQLPFLPLFSSTTPSCKLNLNTFRSAFYNQTKKALLNLLPLHLGPI